jgi:hypothetical protein
MAQQPRRQPSSYSPPREPEISHHLVVTKYDSENWNAITFNNTLVYYDRLDPTSQLTASA